MRRIRCITRQFRVWSKILSVAYLKYTARCGFALLLVSVVVPARATVLLGVAGNVAYSTHSKAVFMRVESGPWGVMVGGWQESGVIAADYTYHWHRWFAGIGAAYLTRTTYINGTRWNFELRAGFQLTSRVSIVLTHFSNCKEICHFKRHGPNLGWDFLGAQYRF